MLHKNGEGYPDPTAAKAIKGADKPPDRIVWFIKTVKALEAVYDLEIVGRMQVRDRKTGREYR